MKKLELMTRELFTRFSLKETGKHAKWEYLNPQRKIEWMKDVLMISDYFMKELQATIKPLPTNQRSMTVYEAGYNAGSRNERLFFIQLVSEIQENLISELEEFIKNNK
jgi:hypothetical protein